MERKIEKERKKKRNMIRFVVGRRGNNRLVSVPFLPALTKSNRN